METVSREGGDGEPFIVIYRSAKYNGLLHRTMQYISTYSRFYLLEPIVSCFSKFRQLLYEILGFLLIVLAAPFLFLFFIVLYVVRSFRTYLVKTFSPNAVICEDLQPRCIFLGKSLGMVTSVVWTRGNVDVEALRRHFSAAIESSCGSSILQKKLTDKYGVRVWLESPVHFEIENHIKAAPKKFYSLPITDADGSHSRYGNKSVLQKYVTSCASQKLDLEMSPWQIYVIPQYVTERKRTCCVLRFHYILLNDPGVREILDGLFMQKLVPQENIMKSSVATNSGRKRFNKSRDNFNISSTKAQTSFNGNHQLEEYVGLHGESWGSTENISQNAMEECPKENVLDEPLKRIVNFRKSLIWRITAWINENLAVTRSDISSWIALRGKQYRFHTKRDLLNVIRLEILAKFKAAMEFFAEIPHNKIWTDLKIAIGAAFLIFRACCNIPVEIIGCLIFANNLRGNAFQKSEKAITRQISWSTPISMDLVEAIKEKTDCSLESIVLTACALALKFYYSEMSLPNPKTIGVTIPSLSGDLLSPTGFRSLDLPTTDLNVPYQLKKINSMLSEYPPWKLIGMYYVFKYISHFLPRSLAYVIIRKLMKRYPLTFNFTSIESPLPVPLPHISLWGYPVDEFTFWRAPHSDFCVSVTLVQYGGIMKLSILSPMKSVDTAVTQKFSSHLNSIAEAVGVEKFRIPYSRKSSPASSVCSSPSILKTPI